MSWNLKPGAEPLPGYRLIKYLGKGGYGEVWEAHAPGGLPKAIKFVFGNLDSHDADSATRELKALDRIRGIRHPFLLGLERVDIIDGQLIMVMELADRNLWDRCIECQAQGHAGIPRDELLRYMAEAAEALDLINTEQQLQHLDIKPQNLFLVHGHVKVGDFGLVKDLEGAMTVMTGGLTPSYGAPETFEGRVSHFTDQYSLAIVYQELLTGLRPFRGKGSRQLMLEHCTQAPDLAPLPEGDQPIIGRGLAKNPDERHPSCTEMVAALRQVEVAPAEAPRPKFRALQAAPEERTPFVFWKAEGEEGAEGPPSEARRPIEETPFDVDALSASDTPAMDAVMRTAGAKDDLCPVCGATLIAPDTAPYCCMCGYSIEEEMAAAKRAEAEAARRRRRILMGVAAVLSIALGLEVVYLIYGLPEGFPSWPSIQLNPATTRPTSARK
jgi:serine/threonine protein kinase